MSDTLSIAGWREPWMGLRDRLLASPRFRRWAAGFPLTRWLARRRAAQLFDLVGGFVYSQVLLACVRLRLFERLAAGPLDGAELARQCELTPDATERLMAAAAALRLVQRRRGGRWGLGPLGAVLSGDTAIASMVRHHEALYLDLADPLALLRGEADTQLGSFWAYSQDARPDGLDPERVRPYSALMAASQPLVAEQVLDAVPMHGYRCLLDVGGGQGAFIGTVARHVPGLDLKLFDLPAVAQRAQSLLAAQGLESRVQVHGGDFRRDPLPGGADVISLVRVLHDHEDAVVRELLAKVRAALPPGGEVIVAEMMSGTRGAEAMGDAYFGFYLLAMRQGRPRTAQTLSAMLREAGFEAVRERRTRQPLQARVLVGRVPGGR